jgi:hypothetical protein
MWATGQRTVACEKGVGFHGVGVDDGDVLGFGAIWLDNMLLWRIDGHSIRRCRLGILVVVLETQVSEGAGWRGRVVHLGDVVEGMFGECRRRQEWSMREEWVEKME